MSAANVTESDLLSSNRFFGNAGRSRWMAGLNLPAYDGALKDWTR